MERLSDEEFVGEAKPAMDTIFGYLRFPVPAVIDEPFTDAVPDRLLMSPIESFLVDAEQFRAIRESAMSVGDEHMLYSILRAFKDPPFPTWRLPLVGYEEYYTTEQQLPREWVGIPHERAIYSPNGSWGVLCHESFAVVGGSRAFIDRLREKYRLWNTDLKHFLDHFRKVARKPNSAVSWVQPLLDHLYGPEAPRFQE